MILRGPPHREGFVLLTVLWVMVGALALTLLLARVGRNGVNAGRNRVEHERAWWRAHDCFARARASIDDVLASNTNPSANAAAWRGLASFVSASAPETLSDCTYRLEAAGTRLDVNAADSGQIVSLLRAVGIAGDSEALAAALLDWRDTDDSARVAGAEAAWYLGNDRFAPRNDSLAAVLELARVRGFADVLAPERMFDTEPGRIAINSASAVVLAAVPGFTDETIGRILEMRSAGVEVVDIAALAGMVSAASAETLIASYDVIVRKATASPDAWILTAVARRGHPQSTATIEARLVRNELRAIVSRVRTW